MESPTVVGIQADGEHFNYMDACKKLGVPSFSLFQTVALTRTRTWSPSRQTFRPRRGCPEGPRHSGPILGKKVGDANVREFTRGQIAAGKAEQTFSQGKPRHRRKCDGRAHRLLQGHQQDGPGGAPTASVRRHHDATGHGEPRHCGQPDGHAHRPLQGHQQDGQRQGRRGPWHGRHRHRRGHGRPGKRARRTPSRPTPARTSARWPMCGGPFRDDRGLLLSVTNDTRRVASRLRQTTGVLRGVKGGGKGGADLRAPPDLCTRSLGV